jgi:hypothetical protein
MISEEEDLMGRDRVMRVAVGLLATVALSATGVSGAEARSSHQGPDDDGGYGRFKDSSDIDTRYYPLEPGTQFVYDGTVTDADGEHLHRVIFTVTDLVKKIGKVRTRVMWDQDVNDGELSEAELAFLAKDEADNVWTIGEYPEEYEEGEFVGAPSTWINGRAGAKAGVLVPGRPKAGTPPFVQGRVPPIEFYDVGQVDETGLRVCVPVGCFSRVVKIREWSPLAPEDGYQLKYYAPRVGLIRIDAEGGDAQEVLELTRIRHLGPTAMKRARAAALELEERAYEVSRVYRSTPPMFRSRR